MNESRAALGSGSLRVPSIDMAELGRIGQSRVSGRGFIPVRVL